MARRLPLVLLVLDGFGLREARDNNAIALARTPVYHDLLDRYPHSSLIASGEAVGLPAGQMGNSEVGHMNMGAGRVVYQDLTRIDKSIREGDFFANQALIDAMAPARDHGRALHLMGLVSDGGVHSHQQHLHALIRFASQQGVQKLLVHVITDGRDTSPTGAARYIPQLEQALTRAGLGRIATVSGRYYAMDRDKRWDRTQLAYDAITQGVADTKSTTAKDIVERSYRAGITDEFIKPGVVTDAEGQPVGVLRDGDAVIFFNFRADRARQLTRAIAFEEFDGFPRAVHPKVSRYTTMAEYDQTYGLPVAFPPQTFTGNFAEALVAAGLGNLRLAETEKYAHVTYFFNCGEERPYAREDRLLVPSQKVATYDLKPEMSAPAIADALVSDIERREHDVVICNFANADMVGHTGKLAAAVAAVETLDGCLGRILTAMRKAGGVALVTADHGNAEQMWDDELKSPHTAHTSNPVPVILVDDAARGSRLRDGGWLRDVAPTLLGLLEVPLPSEMSGKDLRDDE
jgi:2,3-bisphosphoglycerate-independent phosphoglycerate mutase